MSVSFLTLWTVALQAPLSWGSSRQEYWSGLPCPPPGDLSNPGIEPRSLALQMDSLPAEPQGKPKEALKEDQLGEKEDIEILEELLGRRVEPNAFLHYSPREEYEQSQGLSWHW